MNLIFLSFCHVGDPVSSRAELLLCRIQIGVKLTTYFWIQAVIKKITFYFKLLAFMFRKYINGIFQGSELAGFPPGQGLNN